ILDDPDRILVPDGSMPHLECQQYCGQERKQHTADYKGAPDLEGAADEPAPGNAAALLFLDIQPDYPDQESRQQHKEFRRIEDHEIRQCHLAQDRGRHMVKHDADKRVAAQRIQRYHALHMGSWLHSRSSSLLDTSAFASAGFRNPSASV